MIFFPVEVKEGLGTGEGHAKGREKQEAARGILQTLARLCSSPQLLPYVQEQATSKQSPQVALATSALFPLISWCSAWKNGVL